MNYWIENFWDTLKEVISKVDIISINDEESEMITGDENLKKLQKFYTVWVLNML